MRVVIGGVPPPRHILRPLELARNLSTLDGETTKRVIVALEETVTAVSRSGVAVQRTTTLSQAFAWLTPVIREPLLLRGSNRNWWEPLKIDLVLQAKRWLDIDAAVRSMDWQADTVMHSWRPQWWAAQLATHDKVRVSRATSSSKLLRALGSTERGEVLKTHGWDLLVRRLLSAPIPADSTVPTSGVAFVAEVSTPSMWDSIRSVSARGDLVLATDPRILRGARQGEAAARSLWSYAAAARYRARTASLSELTPLVRSRLESVDSAFADVAAKPLARVLKALLADSALLEVALLESRSRVVVSASDQHRYGVLACWAAEALGLKSVVLQHGLPADPVGYLPPRADYFGVFGESSAQFYRDHGVDDERLLRVGLPRPQLVLPRCVNADSLLVPLQPQESKQQREILEIVAAYVRAAPGASACLRVHPGDQELKAMSRNQVLRKLGWPASLPVNIDTRQGGLHALSTARLVLTHDSTFALDAVAAGVPVVQLLCEEASPLDAAGFAKVASVEDLAKLMDSNVELRGHVERMITLSGTASIRACRDWLSNLVGHRCDGTAGTGK